MAEAFIFSARTSDRTCPVCKSLLDAATGISLDPTDPQPELEDGNVTVCAYCGAILTAIPGGFRLATQADLDEVDPALRQLVFEYAARHGGGYHS